MRRSSSVCLCFFKLFQLMCKREWHIHSLGAKLAPLTSSALVVDGSRFLCNNSERKQLRATLISKITGSRWLLEGSAAAFFWGFFFYFEIYKWREILLLFCILGRNIFRAQSKTAWLGHKFSQNPFQESENQLLSGFQVLFCHFQQFCHHSANGTRSCSLS